MQGGGSVVGGADYVHWPVVLPTPALQTHSKDWSLLIWERCSMTQPSQRSSKCLVRPVLFLESLSVSRQIQWCCTLSSLLEAASGCWCWSLCIFLHTGTPPFISAMLVVLAFSIRDVVLFDCCSFTRSAALPHLSSDSVTRDMYRT